MAKILTTLLKILGVILLLALVGVGAYFLCGYTGWDPRWGVPIIVLSLVGVVTLVLFIKKVLYRRREEGFVRQVVEQDEAAMAGSPVFERRQLQDLENRFKEASHIIKHSHLKKMRGDPLYALPWYLLIGEADSGKTTAIRNARLPSSFPELGHPSGEETTTNIDWWFFNDAIFIDTAGRYAVHSDQTRDREEWKKFLSLLDKYRRKEPINGIVITLPADKLSREHADAMAQYGRSMQLRIDQLMRVLGAKLPIYLLITKADQILGMETFCDLLPWKTVKQAMGHLNLKTTRNEVAFTDEAVDAISERLKDLRLMILARNENVAPDMLVFPDEVPSIKPGLISFIRAAFRENPYQEPPILRGIFLSSAHQGGEAVSTVLEAGGIDRPIKKTLPGTKKGIFVHEFFARVLPDDRFLYSPIAEYVKWTRSTRDLGLIAVATLTFFVCALLGASFLKNWDAIDFFYDKFEYLPVSELDISKDIIQMNSFGREISELERANRNWYIPKMGLEQSLEEEEKLKEFYVYFFKKHLQDKIDEEIKAGVAQFNRATPDAVVGQYIEHLVKRINIMKARLDGAAMETQAQMPQPTTAVLLLVDKTLLPTIADDYRYLYLYSLNWKTDRNEIEREMDGLEAMLVRLIEIKSDKMEWIVAWANMEEDLQPVTLSQFWEDKIDDSSVTGIMVKPAFTIAGKERLENFIEQIRNALDDESVLEQREQPFKDYYEVEYIRAWYVFAGDFLNEEEELRSLDKTSYRSRSKWQDVAIRMTSFSNPYFNFMDRMADEIKHLKGREGAPAWLGLVIDFQAMKSQVISEGFVEEGLSIVKTVTRGAEAALKTSPTKPKKAVQMHLKAVEELKGYQQALQDISPVLRSKDHAYQMAVQLFKGYSELAQSGSPFDAGFTATKRMQALIGRGRRDEKVFWELLEAPLNSLLYYTTRETACSLQVAWEEQILAEVQGVPEARMQDELFGEQGVVWRFTQGPMDPFLRRNEKSYFARRVYGQEVPMLESFFSFLKEGALGRHSLKNEYEVVMKGLPIDVNVGAKQKPQAAIVEMLCSSGVQRFENYNFPVMETFKWTPESCGGVKLEIMFREFTLTKAYPRYTGFPEFLVDFRRGTRIFSLDDFPMHQARLEKAGIDQIKIKMELTGHEPVIELIERTPLTAPLKIVYCWN
jgi:type VI secretion system protein ImpL